VSPNRKYPGYERPSRPTFPGTREAKTGVPQAIGTWVSSLTLLMLVLAIGYGYLAPSKGFDRYWQAIPIGLLMAVVVNLIIISSVVITASLMVPNYFQPLGEPIGGEIRAHLRGIVIGIVPLSMLAAIGMALGKRKGLKSQPA